jgi:hypothetical protein
MVVVLKDGLMEHLTRDIIIKVKSMAGVNLLGLIKVLSLEILLITTFMEVVFTNGQMEESLMEIGKTTRWKVMERLHGQMAEDMWDNILMT